VTDVKVSVRLRREPRHDVIVAACLQVLLDDVADEISALDGHDGATLPHPATTAYVRVMRLVFAALVVLAACSHGPAKKPPPEEIPIEGPQTFAGTWLTNDELDWFYRLIVMPDGRFGLVIERGKMGKCEQQGTLVAGKGPSTFILTLTKDSCSKTGPTGGALTLSVASYTGQALTLAYLVGDDMVRRSYTRDPRSVKQ
jgi:hypothetical protein